MGAKNQLAPETQKAMGIDQHPGIQKGHKGFLPGQSGNLAGRPPGSRGKATLMAQALFDENGKAIIEKINDLALNEGNLTALKICIDRILPALKSRPVHYSLPDIKTTEDIVAAYGAILKAASEGHMTPDDVSKFTSVLEAMRRAIESADTDKRLAKIEAKVESLP